MDKKIKILYIHHGKGLGGAPLSLLYLIKGLDKNIYHPLVLFLHDSEAVDLYRAHNIEIIGPLNINDFSHTKIWWFRWYHLPYILKHLIDTAKTLAGTAKTIFKQVRPDLVHLNTSSLWAWAKVAHCMRIPVICHVREPLAEGYLGLRRKLIQHMIKKYTTVIVPICKNDALPWISEDKTTIVYNPVDPQKFDFSINPHPFLKHYTLSTTQPRILFLGGLSEEKGTLLILHVFAKLLTILPDAQLLIAGYFDLAHASSGLRAYLPAARFRKKVAEAIEPRNHAIKLLGPIKNVPEAMAACNVIVFPATVGHFARPVIEAGFMKKPVVASKLPPLDELVIHEKTGYLISPNNTHEWVDTLSLLLLNKALAQRIGEDAFTFCRERFINTHHVTQISALYQKIL